MSMKTILMRNFLNAKKALNRRYFEVGKNGQHPDMFPMADQVYALQELVREKYGNETVHFLCSK